MSASVGMRSLALGLPSAVRTNDYWRVHHPEMVANAEQKTLARIWSAKDERTAVTAAFDVEMEPYLGDPFRGASERRVLSPAETTLSIQAEAARAALEAASLAPGDVDLTLVTTFYPEHHDVGNAAFLARELGLGGTVLNIEAACASSVLGLQTACALVRAGEYERVLVVAGCRYSHVVDETDSMAWFLADGAGAFVVSEVPEGEGFLAAHSVHTAETCGVFFPELFVDPVSGPKVRMRADGRAGKALRDASSIHLPVLCEAAAKKAGVRMGDIDFFVFNTPTAWFHKFGARALGVDPERTLSTYAELGNIGPALMPANLHRAASTGRIEKGDLVMLYAVGSVSSAIAVVMRWGDVALGPAPSSSSRQ